MSETQETHINAYKASLAEAERELQVAQSKVDTLKAQIKEREPEDEKPKPKRVRKPAPKKTTSKPAAKKPAPKRKRGLFGGRKR